ncbi:hypothetical protein BGZ82_006263 [Podila clonocystis]|nr:hypothetical protein BGZ82_006263 [Podila clonocystis]
MARVKERTLDHTGRILYPRKNKDKDNHLPINNKNYRKYLPYHPLWGRPKWPSPPSQGRGSQWPPQPWYDHEYDSRLGMRYPCDASYGWEEPMYLDPPYPSHPHIKNNNRWITLYNTNRVGNNHFIRAVDRPSLGSHPTEPSSIFVTTQNAVVSGTEATESGSKAQVSLLTELQSLNVGSSHPGAKLSSSTPEWPTLSRFKKRPSSIGEEGYYLQQDLVALYAKWKTEYDRNKRVQIRTNQLLDGRRGGRHSVPKNRNNRLQLHRAKGKRATRNQGEDEEFSSGDEQSFSDEDIAGDSGSLTGDSEEDDDGELYDGDSDDEGEHSRGRRLRRRRSDSGTTGLRQHSRDKSSKSSSKKHMERDQATKQEEKRHQCKACGKRFSRPSQLHTHSFTHSGETAHLLRVF